MDIVIAVGGFLVAAAVLRARAGDVKLAAVLAFLAWILGSARAVFLHADIIQALISSLFLGGLAVLLVFVGLHLGSRNE